MLFHGTTIATNALLAGGLARVVLATTAGFRDVLGYRDGTRPAVYDLEQPRPRELVRRRDRIEVAERLSGRGEVLTPLTEEEIERVVAEVAGRQPAAVAVSFLFSYLDSRHEDALAEALAKRLPDVPVTVSSAVAREFREYPRTATAALNAGLRPVVGAYLAQLRSRAAALGAGAPLLVMQSNGGCLPAERADGEAHRLVLSGPAAGVAGAVALGAGYGLRRLVSLDMGGTSLDVCLVRDGVPPVTPTQLVGDDPILCPSVDIVTAGAGGGSIAWVDRAGRLRIGPQSAGASPGPAAFGRGGDRSTVTDAHVVAGTLPADAPLAGGLTARYRRGAPGGGGDRRAARPERRGRRGRHRAGGGGADDRGAAPRVGRARASTPVSTRWSRSAAPGRCTRACCCGRRASAACWCPATRGCSPRPGWSPPTCGSTSRARCCGCWSPRCCPSSRPGTGTRRPA